MRPPRKLLAIVFLLTSGVSGFAGECDAILEKGIKDEFNLGYFTSYRQQIREIFDMTYDEVVSESKKGGGKGQIAIGILKASGGGGSQQDNFKHLQDTFHQQKDDFFASQTYTTITTSTINSSIVQAWQDCMSGKRIMSYYTGDPAGSFTVTIRYVLRGDDDAEFAAVSDFTYQPNLRPVGDWKLNKGEKLPKFAWITQAMERIDKTKPATFSVVMGGKGIAEFAFPAIIAEIPETVPPVDTESEKRLKAIEALRQRVPPYGYRFATNSSEIWTHYNGKRIWVKDAYGITGELGCAVEPLGVFIEEDTHHYYDRGNILSR